MSTYTPVKRKPLRRKDLPPGACACDYCTAKCCRYFALPIDKPKVRQDYDFLRWYLLHEGATLFTDEGTWYLCVHSDCKHLQPDNRCGIYHTRPQICRDYSSEACEFEDGFVHERYFETPEQVAEYAEMMLGPLPGAALRSPPPAVLPIL